MDVCIEGGKVKILRPQLGVDIVDESGREDGDQVTRKHNLVSSKSGNGDGSSLDLGTNHPASEGKEETRPGSNNSTRSGGLVPSHHVPEGDNS